MATNFAKQVNQMKSNKFKLALGENLTVSKDEEYTYLENAVLGTGSEIFHESLSSSSESEDETRAKKRKLDSMADKEPAWIDEEDGQTLNDVLREQNLKAKADASGYRPHSDAMEKKLKEIMGVPKWAQTSLRKKSRCSGEDLLTRCGELLRKSISLNKNFLQISKVQNLNRETNCEGPVISVVKFHPKSTVAAVAGSSGVVSLFQVDGRENTKLHSLQFHNYPIYCGSFLKNGEEIMIGSKYYRHFNCYNLMTGKSMRVNDSKITEMTKVKNFCVSPRDDYFAVCGKTGKIYLFAVATKEFVDSFQMNCKVTSLAFNGDGTILYSHGHDGEVYAWDMNSRRCLKKFADEGCLTGTSLAVSPNSQFLACGSTSGVVNLYDSKHLEPGKNGSPVKCLYNLVTPVTSLKFNCTGEILAMGSGHKESALKFVHTPSMTVFPNFPPFRCPVKKPIAFDFSPNGGFFAVGDNNGCTHLYRLKHYGKY